MVAGRKAAVKAAAPASKDTKAAEPKKAEAAPAAVKEETVVKASEKAEEKKTAVKKEAAPKKKAAPRKSAAVKKAEPQAKVVIQYAGKEIVAREVLDAAVKAFESSNKGVEIKTIEVYVKPEENAAYYAINGEGSEDYKVGL